MIKRIFLFFILSVLIIACKKEEITDTKNPTQKEKYYFTFKANALADAAHISYAFYINNKIISSVDSVTTLDFEQTYPAYTGDELKTIIDYSYGYYQGGSGVSFDFKYIVDFDTIILQKPFDWTTDGVIKSFTDSIVYYIP